jgi:hypothetical protein
MLAENQFTPALLAHRSGTQGTFGFVSRHLSKKAFKRKTMLKFCTIQGTALYTRKGKW